MIINANGLGIPLADGSVDAALCSPPYFGSLRVYDGSQATDWPPISYSPMPGLPPVEIPAQRESLGHEADPFAFVGHLLIVFREVRRVLRPGACLAVNLGDCYAGSGATTSPHGSVGTRPDGTEMRIGGSKTSAAGGRQTSLQVGALPSKNLLLSPARLALAMQADGWILRSRMPGGVEGDGIEPDIVWKKASCMPSSVRDRPTVDFEDVFIFSQRPRYFWDQEAGREGATGDPGRRAPHQQGSGTKTERMQDVRSSTLGQNDRHAAAGRNMRATWTINPEPTDEEHFAAWPVELAARLIRVMTSERGVCPECGAPWVRVVEHSKGITGRASSRPSYLQSGGKTSGTLGQQRGGWGEVRTTGWQPSCTHYDDFYRAEPRSRKAKRRRAEDVTGAWWERVRRRPGRSFTEGRWFDWLTVPATVLDPFAGLGRTWEAARETGRRFIGMDLGLGYCHLALSRNDLAAMERRRNASPAKTVTGPLFGN